MYIYNQYSYISLHVNLKLNVPSQFLKWPLFSIIVNTDEKKPWECSLFIFASLACTFNIWRFTSWLRVNNLWQTGHFICSKWVLLWWANESRRLNPLPQMVQMILHGLQVALCSRDAKCNFPVGQKFTEEKTHIKQSIPLQQICSATVSIHL